MTMMMMTTMMMMMTTMMMTTTMMMMMMMMMILITRALFVPIVNSARYVSTMISQNNISCNKHNIMTVSNWNC